MSALRSIKGDADQMIVVDNASSDESAEALKLWESQDPAHTVILNSENVGFARANNQGFLRCTGDYVLLLNSDTVVQNKGDLRRLVMWLEAHPDCAACGPKLVYPDGTPQHSPCPDPSAWMFLARFLGLRYLLPGRRLRQAVARTIGPVLGKTIRSYLNPGTNYSAPEKIESLSGAALLVRRSVIETIGGLDEGYFMYLEDCEWCIRMRNAGWRLGFVPEVSILHYAGASFQGHLRKGFRTAHPESFRSIMRYSYQHLSCLSRFTIRVAITISLLFQSVTMTLRYFGSASHYLTAARRQNLSNIALVWRFSRAHLTRGSAR